MSHGTANELCYVRSEPLSALSFLADKGGHVRLPPGKFDIQRVKLYRYR